MPTVPHSALKPHNSSGITYGHTHSQRDDLTCPLKTSSRYVPRELFHSFIQPAVPSVEHLFALLLASFSFNLLLSHIFQTPPPVYSVVLPILSPVLYHQQATSNSPAISLHFLLPFVLSYQSF